MTFSGPASGMAGDRGGRSGRRAANAAQRRERNAGQFVKRASFTRSMKESSARDPRARERPAVVIAAGIAGLTWLFGIAMKAQPCSPYWRALRQGPQAAVRRHPARQQARRVTVGKPSIDIDSTCCAASVA